ncbi:sensor histidine kinase [Paenibacillus chartarius]|uniref:histidine kinase n=1 Tax=Paenibacillus chartarius TaxID=747481 RepID=A0ABV6DH74_9BACL
MGIRRLSGIYRHTRIRNKLMVLIAFIVALSLAFTIIVQQYAFSIYDEQIYDKSSQVLNLSSKAIETELKRLEQLSYTIMTDEQIQGWMTSLKDEPSDYEKLIIQKLVSDRLLSYSGSERYVYSIQIFDPDGKQYDAGNIVPINPGKLQQMINTASEASGEHRWMYPDNRDPALIALRQIRSFQNTNFDLEDLGTLVIRINIDKLVGDIAPEEGSLMLVSGSSVIFPKSPLADPERLPASVHAGNGYTIVELDEETLFISHIRSPNTGWTYLHMTPFDLIFDQIVFIKQLVVFVFIGIFVIVILLGIRFSYSITRPIDDLIGRMKLAEKGDFEQANLLPAREPPSMDEIGLLQRNFRLMIERINLLITENYANRLLIKETEFKALQAQINPHFLYNTLESINWMAKVNKQTQIASMVEALAFLLRNSIGLKEKIIPLSQELSIVRSYLTIQQFRFEDRLRFHLDVPESLLSRPIPKLTLQPLVENAIHYALEPTIEPCDITIRGWETSEAVCLAVEDTGPGMEPDVLDKLRRGELQTKGTGIGLLNIDERIKLAFGDAYGLKLEEASGEGARVIIMLPKETEEIIHVSSDAGR